MSRSSRTSLTSGLFLFSLMRSIVLDDDMVELMGWWCERDFAKRVGDVWYVVSGGRNNAQT